MPAVTANAPIQSCLPLSVGAMNRPGRIRTLGRLVHLLAQEVQGGLALWVLHAHVVADAVGRPQAEHGLGGQPLLADDAVEHRAGIAVQLAGLAADDLVGEDRRELAGKLPAWKNGVQSMYSTSSASG